MAQKCVFCGNKPQKKNKEHVIPQWLSKHLGRYKSVCHLPEITDLEITFAQLTFPACEKCNSADSELEGAAKEAVLKMMDSKSVSGQEINTLLDWFDKLRTGLWLGQLMLLKKLDLMDPNFYINDRVAAKDRMLIIERVNGIGNGLGLVGCDTNMFMFAPCALQMWFNDILITSVSTDGLVSGKLGFPKLSKLRSVGYRHSETTLLRGINRTVHPVVMDINALNKTVIYQPIFKQYMPHEYYNTPYVQQHCYDFNNGMGGIFVQKNSNAIQYIRPDNKINITPKSQPINTALQSMKRVFELQNHIVTKLNDVDSYDKSVQQMLRASVLQNQVLINKIERAKSR
jgi:hypothetical protein